MPGMGKHAKEEAMKTRARVSAWLVFISMAGTTMSFQVYHSVKHGHMPWPLAVLYGVVPLFISMLVIEFVSGWGDAPKWVRWFAYLIIGGAMYLSASATGAVVLQAAPSHSSLLFGLLLDGAAILAARFLMLTAKPVSAPEQSALESVLEAERIARESAEAELEAARKDEAEAVARAEEVARQLADATRQLARKPAGSGSGNRTRKPRTATGAREAAAAVADLDTYAEALRILADEPGISASELGRRLGRSESRGRQIMRELKPVPQGPDGGASS